MFFRWAGWGFVGFSSLKSGTVCFGFVVGYCAWIGWLSEVRGGCLFGIRVLRFFGIWVEGFFGIRVERFFGMWVKGFFGGWIERLFGCGVNIFFGGGIRIFWRAGMGGWIAMRGWLCKFGVDWGCEHGGKGAGGCGFWRWIWGDVWGVEGVLVIFLFSLIVHHIILESVTLKTLIILSLCSKIRGNNRNGHRVIKTVNHVLFWTFLWCLESFVGAVGTLRMICYPPQIVTQFRLILLRNCCLLLLCTRECFLFFICPWSSGHLGSVCSLCSF